MKRNNYTVLIIPQKPGTTRKLTLSSSVIKTFSLIAAFGLLFVLYFAYEHFLMQGKAAEFERLQQAARLQKDQIDLLSAKVHEFERKMIDLKQFDRKIRLMTNLDYNRDDAQILGVGGSMPEESGGAIIAQMESALIEKVRKNMDQLLDEASMQETSFKELLEFLKKQRSILASTPSIWPVMGWVTSEFGYRISPFTGKRELHRGMDIATKLGREIVAPADGIVTRIEDETGMGMMILISHGNNVDTYYGHLMKTAVKRNQRVKRGDVIGYVGNSGRSTGPHLHYGVRCDGVYVNPRRYLF
ncbi:MAG: M23 family metallopeptidase [Deltaproteobacteria bacterium]|nr:M23 family metallopeptidase [Deltaproteobacteria bacterium]